MKLQQKSGKIKHFHGLRDFYSMIKFISKRIRTDNLSENEQILLNGVKRNFGGGNFDHVIKTLE
jgi:hypothetical protein